MTTETSLEQITSLARAARRAAAHLNLATTEQKNAALRAIARRLREQEVAVRAANQADMAAARSAGVPEPLINRLELTDKRYTAMVQGVEDVAALPDPIGEVLEEWTRPNGIRIRKQRVPMGVIGIIYEARPNVTVDAAGVCLKAGSAALLKGGKEAACGNAALVAVIQAGLTEVGLPAAAAALVPGGREGATALMRAVGQVDCLIPRGGAGLIRSVVENSRVPVIETGAGVCHVYVDAAADLEMAANIIVNAKTTGTAVCNSAETLLVHAAAAPDFLPAVAERLRSLGVRLRGCECTRDLVPWAEPATEEDWATEYLDLLLAVRVVESLDAAVEHIGQWGTRHSEAIVTGDAAAAGRFQAAVDAAVVYWNASTRFTDGGEFGFGAEIGISTQKLHARGPMGLREITSYKYIVSGDGQIRPS